MSTLETSPSLESLDRELRGELITPVHPDYDAARRIWNGMFDMQPLAIVRALGAVDVVAVVNYARETGTTLAVRGGGHSSAGHSTCDGGIVLDLSRMKGVWVDPAARTARAQAGALWGDVDRETQAFGLAVPGGQISHTGIAGLTLGGGVGWLSRQYGLTIDNLLSVDLVTADGRLVTASAHEHPDLFWGLRGGSGNFGVVVSFEYRLHPVGPLVLGGPIFYALDDAAAALRNARDAMVGAPDEVSLWLALTHAPPAPPIPAEHQGKPVLAVVPFCTDLERGPALLEQFTSLRLADREPARAAAVHGSPVRARRGRSSRPPVLGARRLLDRPHRRGDRRARGGVRQRELATERAARLPARRRNCPRPGRRNGVRRPHRTLGGLGRLAMDGRLGGRPSP